MKVTEKLSWSKVEAGHYTLRVGLHERVDAVLHYNATVRTSNWTVTHHVEGEKSWERDRWSEVLGRWPTLREAKEAVDRWQRTGRVTR